MKNNPPYINIHTHSIHQSEGTISIYNANLVEDFLPQKNFSIGIHPWNADSTYEEELQKLIQLASDNKLSFIGECGLDKLKCNDFNLQVNVFKSQLEIADKFKIPVILHCVKAF